MLVWRLDLSHAITGDSLSLFRRTELAANTVAQFCESAGWEGGIYEEDLPIRSVDLRALYEIPWPCVTAEEIVRLLHAEAPLRAMQRLDNILANRRHQEPCPGK